MTIFDSMILRAETLVYAFNLSVAVTLTAGVGLITVWLLRRRSAPLRYGLLASSLVLALLSPAIVSVFGLSNGGVLAWSIDSPTRTGGDTAEAADVIWQKLPSPGRQQVGKNGARRIPKAGQLRTARAIRSADHRRGRASGGTSRNNSGSTI